MEKQGFFVIGTSVEYDILDEGVSNTVNDGLSSDAVASVFYLNLINENETYLPISVFQSDLTPFQAIIKYLKENKKFSNKAISKLLNRDTKTIWITYNHIKSKKPLQIKDSSFFIPLSIFRDDALSAFELLVLFLKKKGLTFAEISRIVRRDQRTIWTIFSRLQKKTGGFGSNG